MPDAVGIYDPQGRCLVMNRAGKRLLGIESNPDFYLSLSHAERLALVHTRDRHGHPFPPERSPLARALLGEVVSDAESEDMLITALDGQERQLSATAAPIWDAQGNLSGAVFVNRDVTERRRLERRTQQALNALIQLAQTLLVEPAPESALPSLLAHQLAAFTREALGQERVTLLSLDAETRTVHPLAAFGLTPEEEARWRARMEGVRRGTMFGPEVSARLDAGEVVQIDFTQATPDQALPGLSGRRLILTPLFFGHRLLGFLNIERAADLPAFTEQEEALLSAVARLCGLLLERDRLLREREEARARALALEEANKRMDVFLGIASHELKTPLTGIKLGFQLVRKQAEHLSRREPEAIKQLHRPLSSFEEHLTLVEQQIRRLEWLVNDLLDVSRIQAGHLKLRMAPADLVSIVRHAVEEQREVAPTRTIRWQPPASERLPIRADAMRIGQVVLNYLTNALKYSPEDQPVEVGVEAEGQVARVWVRDRGPGIPAAEQEHIWERFHRVPGIEVQSGSGVGLGIGLYISHTIITGHGGQVGVQSAPGAGSTFWFTLPLNG